MVIQNSKTMVRKYVISFYVLMLANSLYGQIADSSQIIINFIQDPPFYKGNLETFIQNKINYPESAKKDSIEGVVIISFKIDTLGMTFSHEIIRGVRNDLNNEALRVSKLIKFDKPALQKGKPIETQYIVPIKFKIEHMKEDNNLW